MEFKEILDEKDYEGYFDLSYDEQNELFIKFKHKFDIINLYQGDKSKKDFINALEETVMLAVGGNVVAQDFLSFIYKKGKNGVFESNYLRSYEWAFLACQGGCKLTVDRMKFFFAPAFNYVANHKKLDDVIDNYKLTQENIEYFFGYAISDMILSCTDISLKRLSKENIIPSTYGEESIREFERMRDRVLEEMMNKLSM